VQKTKSTIETSIHRALMPALRREVMVDGY